MAVILFAHGARKASWAKPFEKLHNEIALQLPDQRIGLAYLELMNPSLEQMVEQLVLEGERDIAIIPLFLSNGGHISTDLPKKIHQLTNQFSDLKITTLPVLMELPEIQSALVSSILKVTQ
jgi:sirohydrochlorin cobaltochelatase